MKCRYINLDGATGRREAIEANFRAAMPDDWSLSRVGAVTADEAAGLAGKLRPAEKACFLSHRRALEQSLEEAGPAFIVEDDIEFSPRAARAIQSVIGQPTWDIIYTDAAPAEPGFMTWLARLRQDLVAQNRLQLVDLARRSFAGAQGYLVNEAAKPRLFERLDREAPLDDPVDLTLRKWINAGEFRGFVIFPFVTTPADTASDSQIQLARHALREDVGTLLRKLFYLDRDLDACRALARQIEATIADEDVKLAGVAVSAMASPRFWAS